MTPSHAITCGARLPQLDLESPVTILLASGLSHNAGRWVDEQCTYDGTAGGVDGIVDSHRRRVRRSRRHDYCPDFRRGHEFRQLLVFRPHGTEDERRARNIRTRCATTA